MITPLPHQQTGMEMARSRPKFGFGWKPGLGKTHLALGVCVERPLKTLALAPKSILHSAWMQDAAHYQTLRPLVIHGSTPARRSATIAEGGWDLAITTYETFRRHHSEYIAAGVKRLIVDESQKARNPEAQITKTLIPFADKMDEVYLLSGTMAPNNVTEYWAQLRMLAGPKARGYYQFCYHYAFPIKKRRWGKDKDGTRKQIEYISSWGQTPEQEVELRRVLEKWVWFLRKEDVRVFPPQQFHVRELDLSEKEEKAYNAISEELAIVSEGQVDPVKEGAVLMKLRQATGGEVMAGEKLVTLGDSKLEALADLLDEIGPDEPVVIWAEFTAQVDRIVAMVKERGESVATIDGRSSGKAGETAAAFQAGEVQRLVCHPAAAGHGITLTRAAYCIYYSMSFSSEQYEQSQNRIHRVGQERPCTYYHLLATVTPDADDKAHGRERGETVDHRCYGVSSRKITASSAREMEVEKARRRRSGK